MEDRINIVENNIFIDIKKLKNFIINEWQSGKLYEHYYKNNCRGENLYRLILSEVGDFVDELYEQTEEKAQVELERPGVSLDGYDKYPKSDVRSIGFEVVDKLSFAGLGPIEEITTDDIPVILEFLDTQSNKSLEAWEKWEKYWANLDYAERRKKLLKNENSKPI